MVYKDKLQTIIKKVKNDETMLHTINCKNLKKWKSMVAGLICNIYPSFDCQSTDLSSPYS